MRDSLADVQQTLKETPYGESVQNAIRLAHMSGHYDPEDLTKYLDLLTKVSTVVPGGPGEVAQSLPRPVSNARFVLRATFRSLYGQCRSIAASMVGWVLNSEE